MDITLVNGTKSSIVLEWKIPNNTYSVGAIILHVYLHAHVKRNGNYHNDLVHTAKFFTLSLISKALIFYCHHYHTHTMDNVVHAHVLYKIKILLF